MRRTKKKPITTPVSPPPVPVVAAPDPYKKTDMLHAIEGYCPRCGSNESIDVVDPIDYESLERNRYESEVLHCNKCGTTFGQAYELTFVGQGVGSREIPLPDNGVADRASFLVADLEAFIEELDSLAEQADAPDAKEWCDGYRTEIGMYKMMADDPKLKRVRQRLLELAPYLAK
jgi:hypothetical protein